MQLEERVIGDVIVLAPSGRMTRDESFGVVRSRLHDLVQEGCHKLVLDLAAVSYMDSTYIGELVSGLVGNERSNVNVWAFAEPAEKTSTTATPAAVRAEELTMPECSSSATTRGGLNQGTIDTFSAHSLRQYIRSAAGAFLRETGACSCS